MNEKESFIGITDPSGTICLRETNIHKSGDPCRGTLNQISCDPHEQFPLSFPSSFRRTAADFQNRWKKRIQYIEGNLHCKDFSSCDECKKTTQKIRKDLFQAESVVGLFSAMESIN